MDKNVLARKTISLYAKTGLKSLFSKIRFWDAPYFEVEALVPQKGYIVDIGCGEGIFSNFIALASSKRKVLGIEIDRKRLEDADRGLKNTSFVWGDATKFKFKDADCVILFHLLHHLPSYEDQEKTLKLCYNGLKKGGKLIIVEIDIKPIFKYLLSWLTDHFLVPVLFESRIYSPIYFRKKNEWIKLLRNYGLDVFTRPLDKGKPFSHITFVCTKK